MFTASKFSGGESGAVRGILDRYVTSGDYLGLQVAAEFPELQKRVGRSHLYVLPPSIKAVAHHAAGCGDGTAGLVLYDIENWAATPAEEQADAPRAIARAKAAARAGECTEFGISPDGQMAGIVPGACSYDLARAIHRNLDWDDIALFNIQAQRLLSDACNSRAGINGYVRFVSTIAQEVRAKSRGTRITAQLSFRYTPPGRMVQAIAKLRGVVDGFYLAYPESVGPRCTYCTAQNLAEVLKNVRSYP